MDYGDSKDLPRRTTADKKLHDKVFDIAKYPKYDGYQHRLASMVYKCLKIFGKSFLVLTLKVE